MPPRTMLTCLFLAACAGSGTPAEPAPAPGVPSRIERDGDRVVARAFAIERGRLPRSAAVTMQAVQPGGEVLALEQVAAGERVLYRASTQYGGTDAGLRTVLVDRHGQVIERTFSLPAQRLADSALARAMATLRRALGAEPQLCEIVHGEGRGEWLRGHASAGTRFADADLEGRLRGVRTVERNPGGATPAGLAR